MNQNEIERYFSVNDEVATVTKKRIFTITEILDNKIRIQPKAGKNKKYLHYDKLSTIINNYDKIDTKSIEKSVRVVLEEKGFNKLDTETYLYGLAREYLNLKRQNLFSASYIQSELEKAVEKSKDDKNEDLLLKDLELDGMLSKNETTESKTRRIKRYRKIVIDLKNKYGGRCQIEECGFTFKKQDGEYYSEAHHLIPLSQGGTQEVSNVVILCANHHRMFHFANIILGNLEGQKHKVTINHSLQTNIVY